MTHFDTANQAGSTGRSLRCRSCGAAFALLHLTPFVQCPHCQQQQQLPAEMLSELQRYEEHVAQHTAADRKISRCAKRLDHGLDQRRIVGRE